MFFILKFQPLFLFFSSAEAGDDLSFFFNFEQSPSNWKSLPPVKLFQLLLNIYFV